MTKKPIKAKPEPKRAAPKLKPYAAIQLTVGRGNRTWFGTEKEAETEARALLEGKKTYGDYKCPGKLVIVKIVGVVERSSKRRKAKPTDTFATGGHVGMMIGDSHFPHHERARVYLGLDRARE